MRTARYIFISALTLSTGCSYLNSKNENLGLPEYEMTTTGMGAATGAAVGAGLGAIVGSATGNAGEGLVIGALAGGATGGYVGSKFQGQEDQLIQQDEQLRRQQELLSNQQRDLEQLKRGASDLPGAGAANSSSLRSREPSSIGAVVTPEFTKPGFSAPATQAYDSRAYDSRGRIGAASVNAPKRAPRAEARPLSREYDLTRPQRNEELSAEAALTDTTPLAAAREEVPEHLLSPDSDSIGNGLPAARRADGAASAEDAVIDDLIAEPTVTKMKVPENLRENIRENKPEIKKTERNQVAKPVIKTQAAAIPIQAEMLSASPECSDADTEVERARNATTDADKLFYYRRALRLCPKEAQFHVEVGRIYTAIGRIDDAKFEFRQAMDLDPSNTEAKEQLSSLE